MVHASTELSPRRQRKRAERENQLLETALGLLMDDRGLTLQRLADEVDLTIGAIYRYFPNKEGLVAALERRIIQSFWTDLEQAQSALDFELSAHAVRDEVAALSRLGAVGRVYLRFRLEHPERFTLIGQNLADHRKTVSDEEDARTLAHLGSVLRFVAQLFEAAVSTEALQPGNARERAMVFWSGLHGSMQLRKLDASRTGFVDTSNLSELTMQTLLLGWGADRRALTQAAQRLDSIDETQMAIAEASTP